MPMLQYFPDNYMWSLGFMRALGSGVLLGELNRIGVRLAPHAGHPPAGDLEAWHTEWHDLAVQLEERGDEAAGAARQQTAHDTYLRSAHAFQWAEAFLTPDDERKAVTLRRHLAVFARAARLSPDGIEIIEVPYERTALPAYLIPAQSADREAPAVVYFGGLDSCKEEFLPHARKLAARGVTCLAVDGPGQAESLKLRGLKTRFDYEVPARAALDYLADRDDVDPNRIGIIGASMGGYYAARAAAFEPRFACAVAYGAQYDYRQTWVRRLDIKPGSPIAAPAHHLFDVLGVSNWEEALQALKPFTLAGVAGNLRCPFLIVHGENDRQILVEDAYALLDEVGSSEKQLVVLTDAEGGSAHCQIDCPEPGTSFIADWLAEHLGVRQPAAAAGVPKDA